MDSRPDRPDRPGGTGRRSDSVDSITSSTNNLTLDELPSPNVGAIPPALSPLDQLALQGRLLAKRFEQANRSGRRMSRLAPLTIQKEFGHRQGYFSSLSPCTGSPPSDGPSPSPGISPHETKQQDKHKSLYPQVQAEDTYHDQPLPFRSSLAPVAEGRSARSAPQSYFDVPRTRSPEPRADPRIGLQEATPVSANPSHANSWNPSALRQKRPSIDSLSVKAQGQPGLLPPRSPGSFSRHSPSIRSVPGDGYDEVEDMSLGGSYDSLQARQLSPSSSLSRSHSPFSPVMNPSIPRSPSLSSEYSTAGLPRPAFNFSRPLSSASRSFDMRSMGPPTRQNSDESAMMRPSFDNEHTRQDSMDYPTPSYTNDMIHTPVSMTSEDFRRSSDSHHHPAPSYTYSKFPLPRGRAVDRQSIGAADFLNSQIQWDQPADDRGNAQSSQARPSSPPSPPRSIDRANSQFDVERVRTASTDRPGAPSLVSSDATIRPRTGTSEISPQEHCDLGIDLHEAGEFTKSTYHLRLAARAGLPEAMFWYGLACRHGWGMKVNQQEGMKWLRKAVDSGQLEVAEDENQTRQGRPTDFVKRKKRQAQYAVAIYELGKCYLNGWGAQADKSLALRCFEIAGNWGDGDALAEAGYCYANGNGCKKDMKKAAKLYREAESKGISMVGNSWIYKDKYMEDNSSTSDARSIRSGRSTKRDPEKKPRDKSRTRTIFGRKKSIQ